MPAEEEVIRDPDGRLGVAAQVAVVPLLQPGIEDFPTRLRKPAPVGHFEGDLDVAARHEEEPVDEQPPETGEHEPDQGRSPIQFAQVHDEPQTPRVRTRTTLHSGRDRRMSAAARAGPIRSMPSRQTRPAGQRMKRSPRPSPATMAATACSASLRARTLATSRSGTSRALTSRTSKRPVNPWNVPR